MMTDNLLLAAIPAQERARLDKFLTLIDMDAMDILIEPGEPIKNVYFPINAVTSTLQEMSDGSSIESGLMGVEGLIGIQLWLKGLTTTTRTLVQISGRGLKMRSDDFIREIRDNTESPLNEYIARYTHAFLNMTSTVAACNRLHPIDQRMCRWLKHSHDRIQRDEFVLRHSFLAQMLGVHRPTVSTAANILQKAGLITYSRGNMKILDAEGLFDGSCECYEIIESQMNKIFERPWRELLPKVEDK